MRIRTQFLITIVIFGIIISIISSSLIFTLQQTARLTRQEEISQRIHTRSADLSYISNNYFLYQRDSDLDLWQSTFEAISNDQSSLSFVEARYQVLIDNISDDMQRLYSVFNDVISFLGTAPQNQSIRVLPEFQIAWNQMAVQNQALDFHSQSLSQMLRGQIDQLNSTNLVLIAILLGVSGSYFVLNFFVFYRSTLKSISELESGIQVIGSGNLDYSLNESKRDEIGGISKSINQMASNLKKVTASKSSLEEEIQERKKAEEALRESERNIAFLLKLTDTIKLISDTIAIENTASRLLGEHLKADRVGYFKIEGGDCIIEHDYAPSVPHLSGRFPVTAFGEGLMSTYQKGLMVVINNIAEEPLTPEERESYLKIQVQAQISMPLIKDGEFSGGMTVQSTTPRVWTPQEKLLLKETTERTWVVTERKKAEEALEERERLYHSLFENSQDGFQLVKLIRNEKGQVVDFRFLEVNSAYETQTGLKADYVVGKTARQIDPNIEQYWLDYYNEVDETGKALHLTNYNKNIKRWIDVYTYSFAKGKVGSLFRDITKQKNMEKRLQEKESLAAIGATAGMVGHDIRNPLQGIDGAVYLAKQELKSLPAKSAERKTLQEILNLIEEQTRYIDKIVADLQDFAKEPIPQLEEIRVDDLIVESLSKLKIPSNINVHTVFQKNLGEMAVDPTLVKRVSFNLLSNAVQALPKGGDLTVRVFCDEKNVCIEVEDTGLGIAEEHRSKIFTPLFTTKSKGQGFGLAACKKMVEAQGGEISFESEEGNGTTFIIKLPITRK